MTGARYAILKTFAYKSWTDQLNPQKFLAPTSASAIVGNTMSSHASFVTATLFFNTVVGFD
jgi:hypothetical protein